MTLEQARRHSHVFLPAIWLEDSLSTKVRRIAATLLSIALAGLLVLDFFMKDSQVVLGVFLIVLSFLIFIFLLTFFFNSFYFSGRYTLTFETAYTLYHMSGKDPLKGLAQLPIGEEFFMRLGLTAKDARELFSNSKMSLADIVVDGLTFSGVVTSVLSSSVIFSQKLAKQGIDTKDVHQVGEWMEEKIRREKHRLQWWTKESLESIPGIGKGLSYGRAYELEKYSMPVFQESSHKEHYPKEVDALEVILTREREANALLVGNEGVGKHEIVAELAARMRRGTSAQVLRNKHIVALDTTLLTASIEKREEFEQEVLKILNQAVKAGNIILVIDNLASFIERATSIGSNLFELIDPYLSTSGLQVTALSDKRQYHASLEGNSHIMKRFEALFIKEVEEDSLLRIIEQEIEKQEYLHSLFFTFEAVEEIVHSTTTYYSAGASRENALDLVTEVVSMLSQKEVVLVRREDILAVVEQKTGVPTSIAGSEEKKKLLNLETLLHKRIVGQDGAVKAISESLRRARSGITNPSRPIGSFLFLGPTGVGKTETTKALADIFFGSEKNIIRLDMSEFNTSDSLEKLTGSFTTDHPGVLVSALREKQYGVLLLDEFEKAHSEIHDLFLQILDEGEFSDMRGERVNVRNMIIIATSNAGGDMLFQALEQGIAIEDKKDDIVSAIIDRHIFRPELVNRFDGVILFHPLEQSHLNEVARLELEKLSDRLKERGYSLVITDELVAFLAQKGDDRKFGARALRRVIQDTVERVVSEKILSGKLVPGSSVVIGPDELT